LQNKKGGKSYYTLLGWKGVNPIATRKVIDVVYFSGDKIVFGYPLFKTGNVYHNRIIFEYSSQASMSLHYDEQKKMIVFDHLTAPKNSTVQILNGPDGTYDALKFIKGHWELMNDVDINAGFIPKTPKAPIKDEELKK
jgi:hypothetical protein